MSEQQKAPRRSSRRAVSRANRSGRAPSRDALALSIACALLASACLEPGSFDNEASFRVDKPDGSAGSVSDAAGDAQERDTGTSTQQDVVVPPPPPVDSGGDQDVTQVPTAETIWIEAESASPLTAPMEILDDTAASGGKYISTPVAARNDSPDASTDGIATYTFSVTTDGTFIIFGRIRAPTTDNDSFWVKVDTGVWIQWNNLPPSTGWVWDDVHTSMQADTRVTFTLAPGDHTLAVAYREQVAALDKLAITTDPNLNPMDLGQ